MLTSSIPAMVDAADLKLLKLSIGLTRRLMKRWSCSTRLLRYLIRTISIGTGHLMAMTSSAHGRSRLVDLITYLKVQPVISLGVVMDHLGVTRRTALSLIGELVNVGCLSNLTARSTSRFWALPSLAARMGHAGGAGAVRGGVFAGREGLGDNLKPSGQLDRLREERDEAQLDRIMADLDSAMSGLDDVVRRAGGVKLRKEV